MCLNETYSKFGTDKNLSDAFPIQNDPKEGGALSPLIFNFSLVYAIRNSLENQEGFELNETHQHIFCADDVNILSVNVNTITKDSEVLLEASREVGVEANTDKTQYMIVSCHQREGQHYNLVTPN
jgi:hypothetical protein